MTEEEKKRALKPQWTYTPSQTSAPNSQKIVPTTFSKLDDRKPDDNYQFKYLKAYGTAEEESNAKKWLNQNPGKDPRNTGGDYYGIGGVKAFTPSASYYKAMESANQLLSQLSSGRTSYTDKVNNLMDQIANRPKFQYDMDTDSLFQNSLQSAMVSGQTAMQDTMGQAAALTGGYGSTYATSAANQAYNSFIQDAYANLPDYYNMALDAYNMEGQNMYNQLGMYQTADDTEYSRLANAYQANFANANDIYGKEYDNYWQTTGMNQSAAQFNAEMAYKAARDQASDAKWAAELALSSSKNNGASSYKVSDFKDRIQNAVTSKGLEDPSTMTMLDNLANTYGLDKDELYDYANSFYNPKWTLGGNGQYADQYGNAYGGPNVSLNLSQRDSKAYNSEKGTYTDSPNDIFTDDFANEYTRAYLESLGFFDKEEDKKKKK